MNNSLTGSFLLFIQPRVFSQELLQVVTEVTSAHCATAFVFNLFEMRFGLCGITEQKAVSLGVFQAIVSNPLYWVLGLMLVATGSLFGYMLPFSVPR
jgi:hypothetical protein